MLHDNIACVSINSFAIYALTFRWMHTVCQNLNTEEEVENTADNGFDCTMCRPYMPSANGKFTSCLSNNSTVGFVVKLLSDRCCVNKRDSVVFCPDIFLVLYDQ